MAYRKLAVSEKEILQKRIEHFNALFQQIKERDTHAYSYDWQGTANDLAALNDRLLKILMQDEREHEKRNKTLQDLDDAAKAIGLS